MEVPDIPFELLHMLPAKERSRYRKNFPNLPAYLFMNNKEKKKYFQEKGNLYKSRLGNAPARNSKTKKIVKFRENYDVRPFKEAQKVTQVSSTKSFKDKYRQEHFSSP